MAGEVNGIIFNANVRADQAVTDANAFINQLATLANNSSLSYGYRYGLRVWNSDLEGKTILAETGDVSTNRPSLQGVSLQVNSTRPPNADPITTALWTDDAIDEFTDQSPTVITPAVPTTAVATPPPEYYADDIALPAWVDQELPSAPVFTETTLPAPSVLNIDAVDQSIPALDILVPSNTFSFVETDYSSTLKTAIEALILGDIQNGGYGINASDEQAIWDRARDRESKGSAGAVAQLRRGIASRGFNLPTGMLFAAERQVIQQGETNLSGVNRDIALKRSDLYVQARQFALQQGLSLESALLQYSGAKQERALNAQKLIGDFALQFHEASVGLFKMEMELRRLYRELHSEQLQTAVAKTDEYKQKLAFAGAEDKRNELRMGLYQRMLEAIKLSYDAQRMEDEHFVAEANIARLSLDASKERNNAYATRVKARSDEFDAYRTLIAAEGLKLDSFDKKLATHARKMDVVVKKSERKEKLFDAELRLAEANRDRLSDMLKNYDAELRTAVARVETAAKANQENIEVWKGVMTGEEVNVSNKLKHDTEQVSLTLEAFKANVDNLRAVTTAVNAHNELNAKSAQAAVSALESRAASYASAMSAIATITESAA